MPVPLLRNIAKRFGVSYKTAEAAWNECKRGINPGRGGKGWGLVVKCVRQKLSSRKKKK